MKHFASRYWAELSGANDRVYAPPVDSGRAGRTFGKRYIASLLAIPLPRRADDTGVTPWIPSRTVRRQRLINRLRVLLLFGGLAAIAAWIGGLILGPAGHVLGVFVAVVMLGYAHSNAGRSALLAMQARPAGRGQHADLYRTVSELAAAAHMPVPWLYISQTSAPNAFAVGSGHHASLCCTTGLLGMLNEEQLRGVIGHELALINNRTALVSSTVGALSNLLLFTASPDRLTPVTPRYRLRIFNKAITMIFGPITALLTYVAVGPSHVYRADAAAAQLTQDPTAMVTALRRLADGAKATPLAPEPKLVAWSHLMIVHPFPSGGWGSGFASLAHHSIDERTTRLLSTLLIEGTAHD